MNSSRTQVKPRTKLEFARLFCSEKMYSDQAAYYWLRNEINSNPELLAELQRYGYSTRNKLLTIKQQEILFLHFSV